MGRKKTRRLSDGEKYAIAGLLIGLIFVVIACGIKDDPAIKEKPWPPAGDIDELSIDDLQKLLDQSLEQGIFELASFYRDAIKARKRLSATG